MFEAFVALLVAEAKERQRVVGLAALRGVEEAHQALLVFEADEALDELRVHLAVGHVEEVVGRSVAIHLVRALAVTAVVAEHRRDLAVGQRELPLLAAEKHIRARRRAAPVHHRLQIALANIVADASPRQRIATARIVQRHDLDLRLEALHRFLPRVPIRAHHRPAEVEHRWRECEGH